MINWLIVEDNVSAREMLEELLSELYPNVDSITGVENITEGLEFIQKNKPELVFLDVELPDGTAFDLLKKINQIDFRIIFTTAHEKYALQAIKYSALDYLLKPINIEELENAIEKIDKEVERQSIDLKIKTLLTNIAEESNQCSRRIILKDKYGIQIVRIEDIIHLEAMGNYTKFFIKNREHPIVNSKILKEYVKLLPESSFFRCHQSHLVNIHYLSRYDKREGDMLVLEDGSKVPLATRKKEALLKIIESL